MIAEFRERPGASLDSVQQEIKFAFDRLGDIIPKRIPNVTVGITETRIAHGHRGVPSQWRAVNHRAGVVIEQTRPADSKYLYLKRQGSIAGELGGDIGPPSIRCSAEWHGWGLDLNVVTNATLSTKNCGHNVGHDNKKPMWAVPAYFPEAGQITALMLGIGDSSGGGGTGVPGGGEHCWLAVADDVVSAGDHRPGPTRAGTGVIVVGQGTGINKFRGGAVTIEVEAGSILWLVGQEQVNSAAGVAFYGFPLNLLPNWGGLYDLEALAIGSTAPGTINDTNACFGYCSLVAETLTYAFERDFPTNYRRMHSTGDANQLWNPGGGGMPLTLYQWARAAAPVGVAGPATILNDTDAVTDIEVL